jgi:hypothetical protein
VTLRSSPLFSTFQSCFLSAVALHLSSFPNTYSHIVVATSGRQSSLAVGFEVGRVYGSVLVVPGHQQRGSLHCGRRHGSGPFDVRIVLGDSGLRRYLQLKDRLLRLRGAPAKRWVLGVRAEDGSRASGLLSFTSVTANVC